MGYVGGVYKHAVVPGPVKELGGGLVKLLALYEPPLHFRDGLSYHLTVQLCATALKLHLRQGGLDEARWAPDTVVSSGGFKGDFIDDESL